MRTLEARGIDREPTIHLGVATHAMENKGVRIERGDMLHEIIARNRARESQENPNNTAIFLHKLKEGYVLPTVKYQA
jgi:hypothetical protein